VKHGTSRARPADPHPPGGHYEQSEFVIVDPATDRVVAGPFASLAAALNGAPSIHRGRGQSWQ
jgi:hypothetical protein